MDEENEPVDWPEFDEEADYGCREDNYWFGRE